jgi:hypothetical protein
MSITEWLIAVGFVFAFGIGIAMATSGVEHGEFLWAKACFIAAAFLMAIGFLAWLYEEPRPLWIRLSLGLAVGGFAFVATPELLRWVSYREKLSSNIHAQPTLQTEVNTSSPETQIASERPPSLLDLYKSDFSQFMSYFMHPSIEENGKSIYSFESRIYYDFNGGSKFYSFYFPANSRSYEFCLDFAAHYQQTLDELNNNIAAKVNDPANANSGGISSDDLKFSGRFFIYYEGDLSTAQLASIETAYKNAGIQVLVRDQRYAATRWLQKLAAQNAH